jgi:hypothetical protein
MSGVWKRAPISMVIASGALVGASAAVWFEAVDRTRLAPAAVVAAVAAGALVLVASDRMLRAALGGEDSVAAGRLVGFVIATEVLAAATNGVLGVGFVLAAAMGLLLSTGRVTLAARHYLDRADAEFAPSGAVELPTTAEPARTTETTGVAGVGASLSAREGADR